MRHLTDIFPFDCFTANLPCKPLSAILRLFRGICGSFCIIAQRTVYRAFKRLYSMACHAAAVDSKKIRMCIFWHISNNDFCYNLAAFRLSYTPIDVIISLVQSTRSRMQVSSKRPPVYERRVMPHEHTGSSYFVVSSICGIDLHRSA